jgi:hypothetical protein
VAPEVEEVVLKMAIEKPAYGQLRVSNELKKEGIFVSPGGVRSIWLRHDLLRPSKSDSKPLRPRWPGRT